MDLSERFAGYEKFDAALVQVDLASDVD